jgi:hypothetical protein
MKRVYDRAPIHVQDVLKNNYGYNPETNIIGNSKSIFERDKIFYEYLCTTGSPGYASTRYEGEEISSYEVMVCNPANFVFSDIVLPSDVTDNTAYISSEIEKYNERINPKENLGKKKRSSESVFFFNKTPPSKFMAFESSPVVYSPDGQVMYSPLRIRRGTPSPIKMTPVTSLSNSPVKGALFSSPEDKSSLTVFRLPGALYASPVKVSSNRTLFLHQVVLENAK